MRVISSSVYHFPYCCTTLNTDGRVHTFTCLRLFRLFPHTSFYIFSHLCIPFFCLLLFLLFFIVLFLYPISACTCFIALNFILLHASLEYLLVCFSFHTSQSSRNVRLPTTHIPPYSPRIVVIMLILSTLGWCPLNVISSKISVSLSTNSQSTGSLTSNSHVPVFALLSPLITVAVTEWKCSLQVSVT